ncbi:MAG: hypothetical protein BGO92_02550 [Magnetospirillum sp. 64-120]|nr:MAG: hypothetical protein BGO92_02550 [Magnetospirillum sp. 64-120]
MRPKADRPIPDTVSPTPRAMAKVAATPTQIMELATQNSRTRMAPEQGRKPTAAAMAQRVRFSSVSWW